MTTAKLSVFLCHSSGDKDPVRKLYAELEKTGWVDPWLDEEKLLPGQRWQVEIPKAVRSSHAVMVCLSKASVNKEGYLQKEIKFALDAADERPEAIFLIPAKLEECDVPERLSEYHWVSLSSSGGMQKLLVALRERARQVGVDVSAMEAPKAGKIRIGPVDGQEYVWIPPGSFEMGCSPGDNECRDWEEPRHAVTISKGFWMMRTPVTVGAYEKFARATGRAVPEKPHWTQTPRHPVVNVSWDDAAAYCAWAKGRLPTEAEWEYAARAGTTDRYLGANLDDVAWYGNNSGDKRLDAAALWNDQQGRYWDLLKANNCRAHSVGEKKPNAWGLQDVLGNVWEWCSDWFDEKYYQSSPQADPKGPDSGSARVLRGGSWTAIRGPAGRRAVAGTVRRTGTLVWVSGVSGISFPLFFFLFPFPFGVRGVRRGEAARKNFWHTTAMGAKPDLRGGSWNNNPRACRASCRNRNDTENRNAGLGFRCVGDAGHPQGRRSEPVRSRSYRESRPLIRASILA